LTHLHATPDRVATRPQGYAQLWIRAVDNFLRKKVGLANPSATHNENHFHLIDQTCWASAAPTGWAIALSYRAARASNLLGSNLAAAKPANSVTKKL